MTALDLERIRKHGLTPADFAPKPKPPAVVYISREEFNLLDATQSGTIYYITETDNTLTIVKGENK